MPDPRGEPPVPRSRPPVFRPSYTLLLVYVVGFFTLYALLSILPELLGVLADVPPGPEQQRIAEEIGREAARGRILYALALSLLTVGLGSYLRILPGLR